MAPPSSSAQAPDASRSILVYDDDCGFCTRSARFIRRHGPVEIVGFSELTPQQRDRLPTDFEECAHLLTPEAVFSCVEAVEQAFARTKLMPSGLPTVLHSIPGYGFARETGYRWVAENRAVISRLLR